MMNSRITEYGVTESACRKREKTAAFRWILLALTMVLGVCALSFAQQAEPAGTAPAAGVPRVQAAPDGAVSPTPGERQWLALHDEQVQRGIRDKGPASLTGEERRDIDRRGIIRERSVPASRTHRIAIAAGLGVITLAAAAGVVWTRTLRRTVRQRTAQLRRELAERKQAEENIFLISFALDNVRESAFLIDENARFHFVNEECCRVLGYTREELLGLGVPDVDPDFPAERWPGHWDELKARRSLRFEGRHRAKDGRIFPVEINANYFEYNGRAYNLALVRDITERRRTEEALRESGKKVRRKLDAILSPETDIGALELSDIIDNEKIQQLMDAFYRLTNVGIGIIDLHGNVLVGTGWQDICTKFHRVNPESRRLCTESDLELSRNVPAGTFKQYRCRNNMWDIATPIMLGDKHVGNIFLGQFLFDDEMPEHELFRRQARRYGFKEEEYLAALDRVPRWSHEKVDAAMSFYAAFARMFGNLSYSNIKLANALEGRKRAEQERLATYRDLQDSEQRYRMVFENSPVSIWEEDLSDVKSLLDELRKEGVADIETWFARHPEIVRRCAELTKVVDVNQAALALHGAANKEELLAGLVNTFTPESFETFQQELVCLWNGGKGLTRDAVVKTLAGEHRNVTVYFSVCPGYERTLSKVFVSLIDITEHKQLEEELTLSEEKFSRAFHASPNLMAITRPEDGLIVEINESFCRFFGYKPEECIGHNTAELRMWVHPEQRTSALQKLGEAGAALYMTVDLRTKSGEIRTAIDSMVFLNINNRKYLLSVATDITERRQAEESLRKLTEELEQRVKERTTELESKIVEIERINKLFVGRELRMVELKKRIAELEARLNTRKAA